MVYILTNGSLYRAPRHGYAFYKLVVIHDIEHVTLVEGMTNGTFINQLTITTLGPDYEKRVYGPFGKETPCSYSIFLS